MARLRATASAARSVLDGREHGGTLKCVGSRADHQKSRTECHQKACSCSPKLFLKAEPGAILANDTLVNLVRGWPALTEKTVAGIHFVQEDSPDEIGRAIAGWMAASG